MLPVFRAAAERLGFTITPPGAGLFVDFQLSGERDGHAVRIHSDIFLRVLHTEVRFPTPFDLGLHVAPAGQGSLGTRPVALRKLGSLLGKIFGKPDTQIGDPQIDDSFSIHADEDSRIGPVLEAAREDLLAWHESGVSFELDDRKVSLRRYYSLTSGQTVDSICADVDAVLALAKRIERAREDLPTAEVLKVHAPAFAELSALHGLHLSTTPLATWGTLAGLTYFAHATRRGPGLFELELGLASPGPWAAKGGLRTRTEDDDDDAGLRVGDERFDEVFLVEGADFAKRLSEDARKGLLGLMRGESNELRLGEHGLHLRAPLGADRVPLAELTEKAIAVVKAIEGGS